MKKINLFTLFTIPVNATLTAVSAMLAKVENGLHILDMLKLILDQILIIAEYMLVTRFKSVKAKAKNKDNRNPDLLKFLGIIPMEKEIKPEQADLLDIIKFFKMLENFMLKRVYLYNIEELKLGQFRPNAVIITNNLPTLLLSIGDLNENVKSAILNLMFSAITVYRFFKVKAIPNITTITDGYKGEDIDKILTVFLNPAILDRWMKEITCNYNTIAPDIRLVMYSGNASSPNSGASTNALYEDVAAVANDKILWDNIILMSSQFKNGSDLIKLITLIKDNISFNQTHTHSRLFNFTAAGGKARIIANVDWVTQSSLSAVHYTLFAILKTIPSDFTFDHKAAIAHVLQYPETEGYNYYSIDLSAATDRLPRLIQAPLIAALFKLLGYDGNKIAQAWLNIVDREFITKGSVLNNGMPVRYAVGQGMGIFTSFPVLSLMHHFIVNCVVGIPTDRYCLVGDDLLFYGTSEEYAKYLSFMKSIGVTVNPGKTIESISATQPTIEFARNFIIEGIRINPIPFGMLYAWNDGKITFETLAWGFVKVMPLALFINIMRQLDITLTYKDNAALGYYIYKNFKIDFEEIYSILLDIGELPHWFTKDNLDKIIKIVSIGNDNLRTQQYINSEFLSTYTSNCIVRHKEEIERNHLIANSITLLAIVDKSVFEMSETISKRLLDTDLIQYDTDLKGGPLLSKRERNFLDLIHQTNKSK